MRHYEAMILLSPELTEEQIEATLNRYQKVVQDQGGTVNEAGLWEKGRRTLAYPIRKKTEGIYLLMQFEAEAEAPKELDRLLRIDDTVLRHIVLRQDPHEE